MELFNIIPPEIKNDDFYYHIIDLLSDNTIKTILELGASSGDGSTEAFISGIKNNNLDCMLFSIEPSIERFKLLKDRYTDKRFYPINAASVDLSEFMTIDEITTFYNTTNTKINNFDINLVHTWLQEDITYIEKNNIRTGIIEDIKKNKNIEFFDVVLIDSSAFTGFAELEHIYGAKYIILDDINDIKNYNSYNKLIADSKYILLYENLTLRNGFCIFKLNS